MELSKFTPSNHDPALLEKLRVGRGRLLDMVEERIKAAAASAERNHTLLVGGRGVGKTFLVTLAHARAEELRRGGARIEMAWLLEDLFWVTTYGEFLAEIAKSVKGLVSEPVDPEWVDLEGQLAAHAKVHGPIVVFVENLDQVFASIGEIGQQRLRRFCQADAALLFVATTTSITADLSEQASPFYEFFTTTELEAFSIDEAAEMLIKIAEHRDDVGDADLVEFLRTDEAKGRLRAIAHLAGSSPRIWATFARGLTVRDLRELVDVFLAELDTLTPYYQEQIGRLAPQQRRVVNQLIVARHPLHVAEIAILLDSDQRSIAKTIRELRDRNWVTQTQSPLLRYADKRRSYYELAEPLAGVALQLKAARDNAPIKAVVEFCKIWFTPDDIADSDLTENYRSEIINPDGRSQLALAQQISSLPASSEPTVQQLANLDDVLADLAAGESEKAIKLPPSLRAAIEQRILSNDHPETVDALDQISGELNDLAIEQFGDTPHADMDDWIERADRRLRRCQTPTDTARLSQWYSQSWDFDSAHAIAQTLPRLAEAPKRKRKLTAVEAAYFDAHQWLGRAYRHAGKFRKAVDELEVLTEQIGARVNRANERLLSIEIDLATALRYNSQFEAAIERLTRTVADSRKHLGPADDKTIRAEVALAATHWSNGNTALAIPILEKAVELETERSGSNSREMLRLTASLGAALHQANKLDEAKQLLTATLTHARTVLPEADAAVMLLQNNLAALHLANGNTNEALQIFTTLHSTQQAILGRLHPEVLATKINLVSALWVTGKQGEAKRALKEIVSDATTVLGADHDTTKRATHGLEHMKSGTFDRLIKRSS